MDLGGVRGVGAILGSGGRGANGDDHSDEILGRPRYERANPVGRLFVLGQCVGHFGPLIGILA